MKINYDPDQPLPMAQSENIEFIKSWQRWDNPKTIRLYDYKVIDEEDINGIPCKGRFTLDSLGDLYGFVLSKNFNLKGTALPVGSRCETRLGRAGQKIGYMIYLSKPTKIQGYQVRDKAGMEDYKVDFYKDGSLRDFKVYEDIEIDGIPCKGDKKSGISLYPGGKLWICYLSKEIENNGNSFNEGTQIIVDKNKIISTYSLKKHLEIMKEIKIY